MPKTDAIGANVAAPVRPWGFWPTIGFGIVLLIAWATAQGITAIAVGELNLANGNFDMTGRALAWANIAGAPVAVVGAFSLARARRGMTSTDYLGLIWPSRRQALGWTLVCVGLLVTNDLLTFILHRPESASVVYFYRTAGWLPVFVLGIVVAAPLGEEFVFRGFLFTGIASSRGGPLLAIAITAAVFSALHTQYDAFDIMFVIFGAVLLGVVRWRSKSLWLCVALHALMNAVAMAETALFVK